jgi:hypothetical protein
MTTKQWIAAVAASVLASAVPSLGQYQVDRSAANDANSRAGSGGRNEVNSRARPWDNANDIVYGNVTGGKEFRGNVGSRDPFAFRGNAAGGNTDAFVRDSSSVTTNGFPTYNAQRTNTYYGVSRAAPPPQGLVQVPGGNGYVPPRPQAWREVDPRLSSLNGSPEYVNRPQYFNMAGPVDAVYMPNAVAVPPVYQSRGTDPFNRSDYTQLNQDLQNYLSPEQIRNLRGELTAQADGQAVSAARNNAVNADPNNQGQPNGNAAPAAPRGQLQDRVSARPLQDRAQNSVATDAAPNDRVDNNGNNGASGNPRLIGPAGQSALYARLLERRKAQLGAQAGARPELNAQAEALATGDLRRRQQQQQQQQKQDKDRDDQPTPKPPADPQRADPQKAPPPAPVDKTPMKVTTLSSEQGAAGLNDMLKKAETQLREGKFSTALDTYEAAERAAPNNPLIKLGKAHAEIGGGFYRRAEGDLRTTFTADQNLLAGQYDLRGFLGDERLQIVEKDLREQVQKNQTDAGPAILLAYVYYNTANERRAAALLDIADKRAAGKDAFVKLLKQNWALPAIEGENK